MIYRKLISLLAISFVAACNAPPRDYWGVEPIRATVNGDVFDVRRMGEAAVAVRVNTAYRPRLSAVAPQARKAIEIATGCLIVGPVTGDPVIIHATIECK